jgi:uncharacterized protein YndB with AHSA1/START domain
MLSRLTSFIKPTHTVKKIKFEIQINAPQEKVWQLLFDEQTYGQWTLPFAPDCRAVSDWKEGSKYQFFGNGNNGLYGEIAVSQYPNHIGFKHLGQIKEGVEQAPDDATFEWRGATEEYKLSSTEGGTHLTATLDALESDLDFLNTAFPKSLELLKQLCEKPVVLAVQVTVHAPIDVVWNCFTNPMSITHWYFASDDWHAPKAINDLRTGGEFSTTMAAKDGSFSFDLKGRYTAVSDHKHIAFVMEDGRKVSIDFKQHGNAVDVIEIFEAEYQNSLSLQQMGWQSILNNFKKYSESNNK